MQARVHHDELDGGPRKGAAAAERFCVVTRAVKPRADLIRFVVGPDAVVLPDIKEKLPGRGVWVTATRMALAEAVKKKVFARAFRRELGLPDDLVATTEILLERSALDALAIAGKAGQVVAGSAKVEAALMHDPVTGVVHARDAAPDGTRKIDAALRQRLLHAEGDLIRAVNAFTGAQLDLALGRANVVHAALLAGPESARFLARVERLERFRSGNPGVAGERVTPPTMKPEDRDSA
jgi:predicted RNA-binding protein YlxR (DUF448 family)